MLLEGNNPYEIAHCLKEIKIVNVLILECLIIWVTLLLKFKCHILTVLENWLKLFSIYWCLNFHLHAFWLLSLED